MYLYAGAADVAALTNDEGLDRSGRSHLGQRRRQKDVRHGRHRRERAGRSVRQELRAAESHGVLRNVRESRHSAIGPIACFCLHGDAEYIDVLERSLYNSVISGVSLDGKEFFYPNPLSSRGDYARSKWFDCSCCPTNLCRFIPSVPGYAYAVGDDGPYVNLFVEGDGQARSRRQASANRTEDALSVGRTQSRSRSHRKRRARSLHCIVRIPGWSRGEAWPSDLYSYLGRVDRAADAGGQWRGGGDRTGERLCSDRAGVAARRQGDARHCRCRCGG